MRAPVAELADAPALGAGVLGRVGSSPTRRTTHSPTTHYPVSRSIPCQTSHLPVKSATETRRR